MGYYMNQIHYLLKVDDWPGLPTYIPSFIAGATARAKFGGSGSSV